MTLQDIYNNLPEIECQGNCYAQCSVLPFVYQAELDNIGFNPNFKTQEDYIKHYKEKHENESNGCITCPMLDSNKRCKIYDKRPLICRLFGAVEHMKCPFGCIPSRYLTDAEANEIIGSVKAL
jgi:Fe-S-cluster containining protein